MSVLPVSPERSLSDLRTEFIHGPTEDCVRGSCRECKLLATATAGLLAAGNGHLLALSATADLISWGYLSLGEELPLSRIRQEINRLELREQSLVVRAVTGGKPVKILSRETGIPVCRIRTFLDIHGVELRRGRPKGSRDIRPGGAA